MAPCETRRRSLGGLWSITSASLGSAGENDDGTDGGDGASNESDPDSGEQFSSDNTSGIPEEMPRRTVGASVQADDPFAVGTYFRPVHTLTSDARKTEDSRAWLLREGSISEIELDARDASFVYISTSPPLEFCFESSNLGQTESEASRYLFAS